MAARRTRWKKAVPTITTITLTSVPFTVYCSAAEAFFPPINNQINVSPPPSVVVIPPTSPPVVVVPPVSPPPFSPPPPPPVIVVPPPPSPPNTVPPPCECPCTCDPSTPEPSTMVAGVMGLAAAAGWRASRRKRVDGKIGEVNER